MGGGGREVRGCGGVRRLEPLPSGTGAVMPFVANGRLFSADDGERWSRPSKLYKGSTVTNKTRPARGRQAAAGTTTTTTTTEGNGHHYSYTTPDATFTTFGK